MSLMIISDDLTGANDAGLQFFKNNIETSVFINGKGYNSSSQGVTVINTDTRVHSGDDARKIIAELFSNMNIDNVKVFFKKIDSTLRGNIVEELESLLELMHFDAVIIMPAYPSYGRITVGGYHLVNQKLIEDTEYAKDSRTPINTSFLPRLISNKTRYQVCHINIEQVKKGDMKLIVDEKMKSDVKFFVMDCTSMDEMDRIVNSLYDSSNQYLWVGSAGLAESISKLWRNHVNQETLNNCSDNNMTTLFLIGSRNSMSRRQVNFLRKKSFPILEIHPIRLLKRGVSINDIADLFEKGKSLLKSENKLVITISSSKEVDYEVNEYANTNNIPLSEIGSDIARNMGFLGSNLVEEMLVGNLILTGGDIAYQICEQLKISALEIIDEVEEGIPLCRATDLGSPMKIVTKAGGFGKEDSLYTAYLKILQKK